MKLKDCFARTTIKGNGRARIDFGNCQPTKNTPGQSGMGIVKVFVDDIKIASAGKGQNSVVKEFDFCDGMELKLTREQWSIISFNSFEVLNCSYNCTREVILRQAHN